MSCFKRCDRLFPRHRGEIVKKIVKTVPTFEIIDKIAQGTRVPMKTGVPPRIPGSLCTMAVAALMPESLAQRVSSSHRVKGSSEKFWIVSCSGPFAKSPMQRIKQSRPVQLSNRSRSKENGLEEAQ